MRNFSISAGELIGVFEGGWGRLVILFTRRAKNDRNTKKRRIL